MAANVLTTSAAISPEFPAAYYKTQALKELQKKYLFYQFARKQPLPKGNGKTVQFRIVKYYTPSTAALAEGTPPVALTPDVDEVLVPIAQYGDYTGVSDLASFTAVDNLVAMEIDKITRLQHEKIEMLNVAALKLAANVVYASASGTPATAPELITSSHALTSLELRKAVRDLKKKNAEPYYRNGKPYFICVVNPDSTYLLQEDTMWKDVSKYQDSEKIENGEIGKLYGCIVVESPFPISWKGENLTAAARNLTVHSVSGKAITVKEAITTAEAAALKDRKILINSNVYTVASSVASASANTATITVAEDIDSGDDDDGDVIYPGEGGAAGAEVQGAAVFGQYAYGNVELEGESNLSVYANESGGPTDPLHQMRTVGVKISGFGASILNGDQLVMIKHGVAA